MAQEAGVRIPAEAAALRKLAQGWRDCPQDGFLT